MGANHSSSRVSKSVKEERKAVSQQVLNARKDEMNAFQNQMASMYAENPDAVKQSIMIGEAAKKQLDRGGKPFDKKDLITILLFIDPKQMAHIDQLETLNMENLYTMIRAIIYDVKHHQSTMMRIANEPASHGMAPSQKSHHAMVKTGSALPSPPPLPPKRDALLRIGNGATSQSTDTVVLYNKK